MSNWQSGLVGQAPKVAPAAASPTPPPAYTPPPEDQLDQESARSHLDLITRMITSASTFLAHIANPKETPESRRAFVTHPTGAIFADLQKSGLMDLPLIDLSELDSDKRDAVFRGALKGASGITSIGNMPFLAAPASRPISAIFAAQMGFGAKQAYDQYNQLKEAGRDTEAHEALGKGIFSALMAALSGYHAATGTPPPAKATVDRANVAQAEPGISPAAMESLTRPVNPADQALSVNAETEALKQRLRENPDAPEAERRLAERRIAENRDIIAELGERRVAAQRAEPAPLINTLPTLTPEEHSYVISALNSVLSQAANHGDHELASDAISSLQEIENAATNRELRQVPQGAAERQGEPAGQLSIPSAEAAQPTNAPLSGEEALRHDTAAAGGAGRAEGDVEPSTQPEAAGGLGPIGSITETVTAARDKLSAGAALAPDEVRFVRLMTGGPATVEALNSWLSRPVIGDAERWTRTVGAINDLHQTISGEPLNLANEAGERGNGSVIERPPAINGPADRDLANGGITVIRPGKDLGLIARYLGSLTQQANRLGNPFLKEAADKIADTTISLSQRTRDAINSFRKDTRTIISPQEWKDRLVPLLNNPNITPDSLPADLPANIKQAYLNERTRLSSDRLQVIQAKRQALVNSGINYDKAVELVPDDWGIQQGYYHHAFPGNWTITHMAGLDERGQPIWEPIDTGWRQITFDAAHAKAQEYLAANPEGQLKVQLDNITMPGRTITDKNRLMQLHEEVKASSQLIYDGADPNGVLKDLREAAGAAAYGPRRPAQRLNPAILPREANLPGWASDIDNYERYIIGIERYKELAPARQTLIGLRNEIAQMTGMPEVQRIGEMPRRYSGPYANALGRLDASIEALEGYPTGIDAAIRNRLQQLGYDPNMVDRAYSFINSAEALLKLGFNPASAGLHLAQTVAATYPVLGEYYTAYGIAHAYSGRYAELVHDLGIQATSNLLDIDTFRAYRGGYLNTGGTVSGAISATGKAIQDTGLFAFSKGVETARRIAAIGAYEKALSEGMDVNSARNYARDTLIRTQFLYSPADAPIALRMLPRPMTQFRNFTLKMAEYVTGLRGTEIPRFLLAMGAIGYVGLPALTALSSAIEKVTGYNPEDEMKKLLPRASRGILGMLGIDYTRNIGFADWLGSRALDPERLLGPAGSDLLNLAKAGLAELQGPSRQGQQDIDTALRNISPEARRLWDEAHRVASGSASLTDPRSGSTIIKNLTPGERVELLTGLTPIRVAMERDAHDRIRKEIELAKDKRGYFVDKLASLQLDMMRGDISEQERMDLVQSVVSLAKMADEYGAGSKLAPAVRERAREMFSERLFRDVQKAPRAVRPEAYQERRQFLEAQPE